MPIMTSDRLRVLVTHPPLQKPELHTVGYQCACGRVGGWGDTHRFGGGEARPLQALHSSCPRVTGSQRPRVPAGILQTSGCSTLHSGPEMQPLSKALCPSHQPQSHRGGEARPPQLTSPELQALIRGKTHKHRHCQPTLSFLFHSHLFISFLLL